jgi:hypothetical protein
MENHDPAFFHSEAYLYDEQVLLRRMERFE